MLQWSYKRKERDDKDGKEKRYERRDSFRRGGDQGEKGKRRGEEGHKYVNLHYAMSHTIHIIDMIGQYWTHLLIKEKRLRI